MLEVQESMWSVYVKLDKLYRKLCFEAVAARFGEFTANEILVLMFLSNENNAALNTARDIAQFRNISKSMVASSVDSLTRRGLLAQERDVHDRRIIHLWLTERCAEIAQCITNCRIEFISNAERGLTDADFNSMRHIVQTINENITKLMEGANRNE